MSSNLNLNKAAAAIVLAGLIGMVTGKVTDFLYYGSIEHETQHAEGEKRGYAIEVVEAPANGSAAPTGAADLSALYATADVKAGEDLFNKKCTTCHDGSKGGANKIGPHLYGVVNRKIASIGDFNYSASMKSHGDKNWNFDELNHFLWGPAKWVKGTMMSFAGVQKDQDRANLIAFMNHNSDSPAKFPAVTAKPAEAAPAKDAKVAAPAADAKEAKPAAH
ncbi:MAG: c-type cytochrome [Rickettsiales bacterium]